MRVAVVLVLRHDCSWITRHLKFAAEAKLTGNALPFDVPIYVCSVCNCDLRCILSKSISWLQFAAIQLCTIRSDL